MIGLGSDKKIQNISQESKSNWIFWGKLESALWVFLTQIWQISSKNQFWVSKISIFCYYWSSLNEEYILWYVTHLVKFSSYCHHVCSIYNGWSCQGAMSITFICHPVCQNVEEELPLAYLTMNVAYASPTTTIYYQRQQVRSMMINYQEEL